MVWRGRSLVEYGLVVDLHRAVKVELGVVVVVAEDAEVVSGKE